MSTTFCGDYPCEHYFYIPYLTMNGTYVVKDIDCDVTMSNDIALCTYHAITMHYQLVLLCITMPNYDISSTERHLFSVLEVLESLGNRLLSMTYSISLRNEMQLNMKINC